MVPLFALLVFTSVNAQNVTVNPGAGSYPTLKDAFDAINAGTHTGAVTVDIVASTLETSTATLNSSGTGSASYASVVVKPSGGARTIEGAVSGAVIRLAGADNVTIDGRLAEAGEGRNLFITNLSSASGTAAIWLSQGDGTALDSAGAKNNVIRNCVISTRVSVTTSANVSFGVLMSGTSVSASSQGRNNDNNIIKRNGIQQARYGVCITGGGPSNLNDNNLIDSNEIGSGTGFGFSAIGKAGIFVQFQNNCIISKNIVQHIGGPSGQTSAGADRVGIAVGSESWSAGASTTTTGTNNLVNANIIKHIREGRTLSAVGILCATTASGPPTGNVISNNVIYDVRANATSPDVSAGIAHSGNRGDLIAYNSIHMAGDLDPAGEVAGLASRPAIGIDVGSTAGDTALTIKNNSVHVDCTADTMTMPTSYAIVIPNAYSWGTGGGDFNNYYAGTNPLGRIGGLRTGTAYPFSQFATLASWQTAFLPAQDANSISADPLYSLPPTTYLLMPQLASPLKLEAVPLESVTRDILNESRSHFTPTIGAYEYDSMTLPVELSSFTHSVNGRNVVLSWTTVAELNNSGFDIERSSAVSEWTAIGNVQGRGTAGGPADYSYTDRNLASGRYSYRLKQVDYNGNFEYFILSGSVLVGVPGKFSLSQNYPNPFNPATSINFDIPVDSEVKLNLYDLSGRKVANIMNEFKAAGYYTVSFDGSGLASGAYLYKIEAGNFADAKRMLLVK